MKQLHEALKERIDSAVRSLLPEGAQVPVLELATPPNPELGDVAMACFPLARVLRQSPHHIARALASIIDRPEGIERVEVVGPYVNFFFARPALLKHAVEGVLVASDRYGTSDMGRGRRVVLEFSSPNIAKPFGIHHLRTTMIGQALSRIFEALGYEVIKINYLGDWGTQFGQVIAAYKCWGDPGKVQRDPMRELLDLYVRFNKEAQTDSTLEDEGRAWFCRLEDGDPETTALWQQFRDWSVRDLKRVYSRMGISFDSYDGESLYYAHTHILVEQLRKAGLLQESEGALVVPLDNLPPCLIKKKDGATLYATRDLAAAIDRWERYHFDHMLYVVANQQQLHFQQLFAVLRKMGFPWVERCEHVGFGWVTWGGRTMSTRRGHVVLLEQVIEEAASRSLALIDERSPHIPDKKEVAYQVGLAAVAFGMLAHNRQTDISFSWEAALNLEGDTGPYVQYTHARACSLLRKASPDPRSLPSDCPGTSTDNKAAWDKATSPEEVELAKLLLRYPEAVLRAAAERDPSPVARYLLQLCGAFNTFYHVHRVIGSDAELERLLLTDATRQVIRNGLKLLGLAAPEEM